MPDDDPIARSDDPLAPPSEDPLAPARVEAFVRGRVQGVGFRYFAWREALDLGLAGWVANEADGSVHCIAEGPRSRIHAFLDLLRGGPPAASVDRVDVVWTPPTGALGPFSVRSGGHRGD